MASRSRVFANNRGIFNWTEIRYTAKFVRGKGVRNNREFVITMFVICVNPYNGKDRGKICTSEIVSLYPSIHCICVCCKRVPLYNKQKETSRGIYRNSTYQYVHYNGKS